MINQLNQEHGYNWSLIKHQIDKANLQQIEKLLEEKKKETTTNIPLSLKYNRTLPKVMLQKTVMKHWHLLHINPNLAEIFQSSPILTFR